MADRRPIVVITDAARYGDDCVAIAMLLNSSIVDVKLIVCTSGNVWAEDVKQNIGRLLRAFSREDIPVVIGLPAQAHSDRAGKFVTQMRLMEIMYAGALSRPAPLSYVGCQQGYRKILKVVEERPEAELMLIGPASSLAAIIREAPAPFVNRKLFVMGGVLTGLGNATRAAEFNFWFDPGAAEVVLSAGCNTTLLPLDVIRNVALPTHAIAAIRSTSPGLTYVKEYIVDRQLKIRSFHMWDEVLSAVLLNPSLVTKTSKVFISVETRDGSEYGKVRSVSATRGNLVKVISEINDEATEAFIIDALK